MGKCSGSRRLVYVFNMVRAIFALTILRQIAELVVIAWDWLKATGPAVWVNGLSLVETMAAGGSTVFTLSPYEVAAVSNIK